MVDLEGSQGEAAQPGAVATSEAKPFEHLGVPNAELYRDIMPACGGLAVSLKVLMYPFLIL